MTAARLGEDLEGSPLSCSRVLLAAIVWRYKICAVKFGAVNIGAVKVGAVKDGRCRLGLGRGVGEGGFLQTLLCCTHAT